MKSLQERSVSALIKQMKKINDDIGKLYTDATEIQQELKSRGWHHNYNHKKHKYEWQPNEQEPYGKKEV